MARIITWPAYVLAALAAIVFLVLVGISTLTMVRENRVYAIAVAPIAIPTDAQSIEAGRRLATIRGCQDCHGSNLGGNAVIDDPLIGRAFAANLTSGKGGIGATYSDLDFVRAIRHGIDPTGHALFIMPVKEFNLLSDEDLGQIIAYVKSVPPVDNVPRSNHFGPLGQVLSAMGAIEPFAAASIDHDLVQPASVTAEMTVAYGDYIVRGTCVGCHGDGLSGGQIPGTPPTWPPARNLTPSGQLKLWDQETFFTVMRTGVTPGGGTLDNEYMPWRNLGLMTDVELGAVWLYLNSVPPRETGTR